MFRKLISVAPVALVLTLSGVAMGQQCSGSKATADAASTHDIVDTAVSAGSFKTLVAAVQAAGLAETLKGAGPFTIFAPSDAAFAKLPAGTVESLLKPENKDKLVSILTYHVVAGKVEAKQVVDLKTAATVNGQRVAINAADGKVRLDSRATVTQTDIACSNGVIHVIDEVIMPVGKNIVDVAGEAGSFGTLITAIKAAGLADALKGPGPFTVFAPSDAAFGKLPPETLASLLKPENKEKLAKILKLHVVSGRVYADQVAGLKETPKTLAGEALKVSVSGGKVMLATKAGKSEITATDIQASNGVIHVIDSVLLPD